MPKRVNPRQANMVDENVDMIAMVSDVCAMISEVNLVGTNNSGWWIDTGATRHVCADKSMFHSFRAVDNGQKLYMGNSATADIKGEGDVILKMTSEEKSSIFESDKFVLSKNQMYVGKGYAVDAMFKLNRGGIRWAHSPEHGIRTRVTAPINSAIGIAERKNHTLKEMVTAMLISSGMSQDMWGEAILTATYLLNKIPVKKRRDSLMNYGREE
ncbi:pol polyprotein [Tanacetum coccineum]